MNGIPVLTLMTVLPQWERRLRSGQASTRATWRMVTALAALRWRCWCGCILPGDGSIGLVEHWAWAPSLGIEYHLGVDGLGALMLLLSAIVTLMAVDAAHRVHHEPGLLFCAGAAAGGGAVRVVHGAEFLSLVFVLGTEPDSGILPDQAVGRSEARTGGDAVLCVHDGGKRGAAAVVSGGVPVDREHGFRPACCDGCERRAGTGGDGAPWGR